MIKELAENIYLRFMLIGKKIQIAYLNARCQSLKKQNDHLRERLQDEQRNKR
jgi:hypothetical protein